MGMSKCIKAFIPDTDETYQKHKKVLLACVDAEIKELPKETAEYFGSKHPEMELLEEKLEVKLKHGKHFTEFSEDMTEGFEVNIASLPKGTTKLKFCISF